MPVSRGMVLYYNAASPKEGGKAKAVFATHGLRIRAISPEELGCPVGSFTGLLPKPEALLNERAPLTESIMVFSGLGGPALDRVLSALLRAGVPRSVYKAIVTPGNATWDFYQLCEELKAERAAVEGPSGATENL
ncbi:MAG TPA: DUF3783 domain-containing protein [Candidatus Flavonifractor merdigallinarum]|uniref:DUF3783 domain-containing protein n=1 Tax=Candidatus Flavonifractor merdigallinarum TaxID=2838589 RepID=A0A9D2BYD6_9FIRM|nr:DUF3783 domain-containing protein [Candidatus Flavonifractor merdigallinarum]